MINRNGNINALIIKFIHNLARSNKIYQYNFFQEIKFNSKFSLQNYQNNDFHFYNTKNQYFITLNSPIINKNNSKESNETNKTREINKTNDLKYTNISGEIDDINNSIELNNLINLNTNEFPFSNSSIFPSSKGKEQIQWIVNQLDDISNLSEKDLKNKLVNLISSLDQVYYKPQELQILASKLNLSVTYLTKLLRYARKRKRGYYGKLSKEQRYSLKSIMNSISNAHSIHNNDHSSQINTSLHQQFNPLNTFRKIDKKYYGEFIRKLSKEMNIGPRKLGIYLYQLRRTQQLSKIQKDKLIEWIKSNHYEYSNLTKSEQQRLSLELGLHESTIRRYLYNQIKRRKLLHVSGSFTKYQIDTMRKWFEENRHSLHYSSLDKASSLKLIDNAIITFSTQWNLPKIRIREYLRRLLTSSKTTLHQQNILQSWIQSHSYDQLSKEECILLSKNVGLDELRVRRYIYDHFQKKLTKTGRLSTNQIKILRDWTDSHQYYKELTTTELEELSKVVQLQSTRVREYIYRRMKREGKMHEEKN